MYGGDGTLNRILNNIIGTKNIIGIIPLGTGNDFSRSIKIQNKKTFEKVDIAKINNKYFINIACFGIDADIGNNKKIIKSKLIPKSQKYNISIFYTFLKFKNKKMKFKSKEKNEKGKFVTIAIANGMYYGGGYLIAPNSKYNDGLLDIYYVKDLKKIQIPPIILKLKKGTHIHSKHVSHFKTNKITLEFEENTICNIDGEELESKKFTIELVSKAITIYNNKELTDKILN